MTQSRGQLPAALGFERLELEAPQSADETSPPMESMRGVGEPELLDAGDPSALEASALARGAALRRLPGYVNHRQEQPNWCWAAVSLSVDACYADQSGAATTWSQCSIVNAELNQTSCCDDGSTPACDRPWYLDLAFTRVGRFRLKLTRRLRPVETRIQIDANRPYGIRIGWFQGGGHFVGVSGFDAGNGTFEIADPWYGTSVQSHAIFPRHYQGGGRWTHSYATQP